MFNSIISQKRVAAFFLKMVVLAGFLGGIFSPLPHQALANPIRILPLGDSITQGGRQDRQEYTYRYPLFCMLKNRGINVDFIGSLKTGLDRNATWPDCNGIPFDRR